VETPNCIMMLEEACSDSKESALASRAARPETASF